MRPQGVQEAQERVLDATAALRGWWKTLEEPVRLPEPVLRVLDAAEKLEDVGG